MSDAYKIAEEIQRYAEEEIRGLTDEEYLEVLEELVEYFRSAARAKREELGNI